MGAARYIEIRPVLTFMDCNFLFSGCLKGIGKKIYTTLSLNVKSILGYNFQRKSNGDIFVVEMSKHEHKFVITLLMDYLKVPNDNMIYDPSNRCNGSTISFNPSGVKELIVLNVAIYPNIIHVRKPSVQHPGTSGANML